MSISIQKLFFIYGVFICASSGRIWADGIADDWAALPRNHPGVECKLEHFAKPWPNSIHLGKKGFLLVGTSSFAQHQVFEMESTGDCVFVFCNRPQDNTPPIWRQLNFKISKLDAEHLIATIENAGVKKLEQSYVDPDFSDGRQAFFSISDGTNLRSVWMNNCFPDQFRQIIQCVARLINSEHLDLNLAPISNPLVGRDLYGKAFPADTK